MDMNLAKVYKRTLPHAAAALFLLVLHIPTARAMSIIYEVNRVIGAGTVTGFIETDGTLGGLATVNITDWSFTLTAPNLFGGSPSLIDFTTSNVSNVQGSSLTATLDNLLFNFSSPGGLGDNVLFQGANDNYWCLQIRGCTPPEAKIEFMGFNSNTNVIAQSIPQEGLVIIASVTVVPEPSTMLLLGSALAGLGFFRLRRKDPQNPINS